MKLGAILATPMQEAEDLAFCPLTKLVGLTPPSMNSIDLRSWLDAVQDQSVTSSCVANAVSSAMFVASAAKGEPIKRPSRRWLYAIARYTSTPGVLQDNGSSAHLMLKAAERHGIVSEERMPFDPLLINEQPPFDDDIAGQDALFRDYWLAGSDPAELKAALEQREVPTFAAPIYQNFMDWSSDDPYTTMAGDFVGWHMLAVLGYSGDSFLVLNSWGPTWCRDGFIWMSGAFLQQYARDRYVARAAPNPR